MVITAYASIAHPPSKAYQPSHLTITFDPISWTQQVLFPSLPTSLFTGSQSDLPMTGTSDTILQVE